MSSTQIEEVRIFCSTRKHFSEETILGILASLKSNAALYAEFYHQLRKANVKAPPKKRARIEESDDEEFAPVTKKRFTGE
jgi:ribosomal protein L20